MGRPMSLYSRGLSGKQVTPLRCPCFFFIAECKPTANRPCSFWGFGNGAGHGWFDGAFRGLGAFIIFT